ncbi:MAG: hypothetical protein ACLPTF_16665 [Steroidobacteraceae bacterium]
MSEIELLDYFNEHVFYELLMLNYARQCLEKQSTQLEWNVMFAAFNVSARNLYDFLNNNGDRRTDMNVDDYKNYRNDTERGSTSDVTGTLGLLNAQCLHMGKKRFKEPDKKINLDRIRTMSAWVVSNMDDLLKSFKEEFRSKLKSDWANLIAQKRITGVSGPTGPAWSVLTTAIATGPTCGGEWVTFDVPPKK